MAKTKRIGLAAFLAFTIIVLAFTAVFSLWVASPAYALDETEATDDVIANKGLPLKFSVNVENGVTSGGAGGSYSTVATADYVVFEIVPESESVTNVKYYFLESDSTRAEGVWQEFPTASLKYTYQNGTPGNSFHKFIHFKSTTVLSENESNPTLYAYTNPRYVDLRFLARPEGFAITGVSATVDGNAYDTSSEAKFTSSDIRFSIGFNISNETAIDNLLFTYSFVNGEEREWRNLGGSVVNSEGTFSYNFEISEDFFGTDEVKAVNSRIVFRVTTITGEELGGFGETEEIWVRYDAEQPIFAIESDGRPSGQYNDGAVYYYIIPDHKCLSDVRYYYSLDGDPENREEIEAGQNGRYRVEISETSRDLAFYAETLAGVLYTVYDEVLIDPVTPDIEVLATDRENRVIGNGESARDSITFKVVNDAANTSPVRYLFSADGENFRQISPMSIDGVQGYYVVQTSNVANTFFEGTYYFKLESAAGLVSETVVFDFTVESNIFDFRMKDLDFTTDDGGWVSSVDGEGLPAIPVSLRTVTDRYEFFYSLSNRPGRFFPIEVSENGTVEPSGSGQTLTLKNFDGFVKDSFQTARISFYAVNRAGVRSAPIVYANDVSLDSHTAAYEIGGNIEGGAVISEGDWVNGHVEIRITPNSGDGSNVSGFKVYVAAGEAREELKAKEDGTYLLPRTMSGTTRFVFVTGVGVETYVDYRVNIDSSDIRFRDGIYADVITGNKTVTVEQFARMTVAEDVSVKFYSNEEQKGHFAVYYKAGESGNWIVEDGDTARLDLSALQGKGRVTYYFKLVSKATDSAGARKETGERTIILNYNRVVADITVTAQRDTSQAWDSNQLEIYIENNAELRANSGEFVYQVSKNGISNWTNIDISSLKNDEIKGHARYFYVINTNFNGTLYFRALNSAGYAGSGDGGYARITVMVDATAPMVARAIKLSTNELGEEMGRVITSGGGHQVYASGKVTFVAPTEAESTQFMPSLFFLYEGETAPARPETQFVDGILQIKQLNGWRNLATAIEFTPGTTLSTNTLWLYATNGAKDSGAIKVTLRMDRTEPTFRVSYPASSGATSGDGAAFTYNWATSNTVELFASSTTDVFYQYSTDGVNWIDMNPKTDVNGNVIATSAGTLFRYTFENSIKASVEFRVVNMAGAVAKHPVKANLRVDKDAPTFNLYATVNGKDYVEGEWTDNFISFRIEPMNQNANPSGVEYSYVFLSEQGTGSAERHKLNTTTFTSNNIIGLISQGGIRSGSGTLQIYATSKASASFGEGEAMTDVRTMRIKIDALTPDFDIVAFYDKESERVNVESGGWVSASTVYLEIANLGSSVIDGQRYSNVSDVTLTYRTVIGEGLGATETFAQGTQLRFTEETTLLFVAESQSGKRVEKYFEVKIDTTAPEFVSHINNGQIYYVDQRVSWLNDDDTTASSTLNGIYFENGGVVSTENINLYKFTSSNSISDPEYGRCELVVSDYAGNTSRLVFYMRPFRLTEQNITLSEEDRNTLEAFKEAIRVAGENYVATNGNVIHGPALTPIRTSYFNNLANTLTKRLDVLVSEINSYRNYLVSVAGMQSTDFTLQKHYYTVRERMDEFAEYDAWKKSAVLRGIAELAAISGETFIRENNTYKYVDVYNIVRDAYSVLDKKMESVRLVEQRVTTLPATKVVTDEDYADVRRAYDEYLSLSADQKSMFSGNLYQKLIDNVDRCEFLRTQNEELGVALKGESIPPYVRLQAAAIDRLTDDYIRIQDVIMAGTAETEPRALTRVVRVSFSGENSEKPSGTVTVQLEIPEDYRVYTAFAVYQVLSDGTVVRVSGVKINPDGRSVSFESDEAKGTYALAANANIQQKTSGDKVYGTIMGIELNGTIIMYIAIGAAAVFLVLIAILIITAIRRRRFLDRYDKKHRYGLAARGITAVPKGNKSRRRNPLNNEEYMRNPHPDGVKLPKEEADGKKTSKDKNAPKTAPQPAAKPTGTPVKKGK